MKFVIATLALVCAIQVISAAPTDEVDCGKIEEIFDEQGLASGVSFSSDKYVRATTRDELNKRCPEMYDGIKTLKRYNSKCLTGLTQQVFSSVFKNKQEYTDRLCKDNDYANKAIEAIKCVQDNLKEPMKAQEERAMLLSQVLSETQFKDEKEKVTRMCCTIVKQKQEITDVARGKCDKALPFLTDYIDSYLAEASGIVCPDLDKLVKEGECNKMSPISTSGAQLKYQFLLAPVMKLVKTLEH